MSKTIIPYNIKITHIDLCDGLKHQEQGRGS